MFVVFAYDPRLRIGYLCVCSIAFKVHKPGSQSLQPISLPSPMFPSAERNDCGNQERFYEDNQDAF